MADEKKRNLQIRNHGLQKLIYTVRDTQVMLDSDLAELYGVPAKRLNEQVKRNVERFPAEFRFQLTKEEHENLRSQIATSSDGGDLRFQNGTSSLRSQNATLETDQRGRHRKYLPYVFTEQGVAMLSAVLRSETAVQVSIQIMQAFVGMRRFLIANGGLIQRVDSLEKRQMAQEIQTDDRFEKVFKALESGNEAPAQGVFFNGQIFDAYRFVNDLLRQAKKTIVLIDNYVDDTVLEQLAKRRKGVTATIFTKAISKQLALDLKKHNEQYSPITIHKLADSHDRFLMIDEVVYHIGASLKDLGKKWFAFSKMDQSGLKVIEQIRNHWTADQESKK